jgi:hypothetical protein
MLQAFWFNFTHILFKLLLLFFYMGFTITLFKIYYVTIGIPLNILITTALTAATPAT